MNALNRSIRNERKRLETTIGITIDVLKFIQENPCCTKLEVAEAVSRSQSCCERTVYRYIRALISINAIEQTSIERSRHRLMFVLEAVQ